MVELKLFLMPPLKRSGRVKAFLENTTRRVEIFQKSRLGLDSSLEGRFIYLHQKQYVQPLEQAIFNFERQHFTIEQ